ncbi:MAG: peptide chain release factor 1 [Planctomycetota bacterium]
MVEITEQVKEKLRGRLEDAVDRHGELEQKLADPELAGNSRRYARVAREHGQLSKFKELHGRLSEALQQKQEADALLEELDDDPEMAQLAEEELKDAKDIESEVYNELLDLLCNDPEDQRRSIVMEIRSGTGGDEASLFAADLFQMYGHYAEQYGWSMKVMDRSSTDMGGFKYLIVNIQGKGAWQRLQYESGGHRVQRIPKTESQGRIHTSLATVAVLPEAREVDIELDPSDLDIGFMRSQGPGGQSVNKVNSCVRIVHKPTGVSVKCQEEKSQHKNRKLALKLLRTKLYERRRQKMKEKRDELRRSQVGSGDRNERIRTYNFPQDRITDHRIGLDVFGIEKVLGGELDEIINALMTWDRQERIRQLADAN